MNKGNVGKYSRPMDSYGIIYIYIIYIYTLGFQPPLKTMRVDLTTIAYNPKGLNHRNWGKPIILMVVEAQGESL